MGGPDQPDNDLEDDPLVELSFSWEAAFQVPIDSYQDAGILWGSAWMPIYNLSLFLIFLFTGGRE